VQPGRNNQLRHQHQRHARVAHDPLLRQLQLFERRVHALVTGGLGWTWVDTNIPNGLPETFCWYYPWWGSYCATGVPTADTTKFSYNLGAGVRYDYGRGVSAQS
jgi:opacity protein-like surface antigen